MKDDGTDLMVAFRAYEHAAKMADDVRHMSDASLAMLGPYRGLSYEAELSQARVALAQRVEKLPGPIVTPAGAR